MRPRLNPFRLNSSVDRPRIAPGVKMVDVVFQSAALRRKMPYRVLLPETIKPGEKLKTIYLLHGGYGGNFHDWSNHSDVSRYAAQGLILVMPEGGESCFLNAARRPKNRYEDYLLNDVVGDVETRFPVASGTSDRALIGYSSAAIAAIRMALTRPEFFAFVGAFSTPIAMYNLRPGLRRPWQWWIVQMVFGPPGSESRRALDPFILADQADPDKTPFLYMAAGESECWLEENRRLADALRARNFACHFEVKPGQHDWATQNRQLPLCFDYLFTHLYNDREDSFQFAAQSAANR